MLERILVPLDGSRFAEAALPLATSLARAADARVELVSVVDDLRAAAGGGGAVAEPMGWETGLDFTIDMAGSMAELMDALRRRRTEYLAEWRGRLEDAGVAEMVTTVVEGIPESSLADSAEEADADLVVMSTHGRGPLERAWLGSVADRLVRTLHVPVLMVRPDEDGEAPGRERLRRILVSLDGSALAEAALGPAGDLARLNAADLVLVRVTAPPVPVGSAYMPETAEEAKVQVESERQSAGRYLDTVAARLRDGGAAIAETLVRDGPVARALLEVADEVDADVVAMATHGRGGLRRWVLGSVSDKVLRGARIPVLLVRPEPPDGD